MKKFVKFEFSIYGQMHYICPLTDAFIYPSLACTAPVYLADKCMLVSAAGRCPLRTSIN